MVLTPALTFKLAPTGLLGTGISAFTGMLLCLWNVKFVSFTNIDLMFTNPQFFMIFHLNVSYYQFVSHGKNVSRVKDFAKIFLKCYVTYSSSFM